MTTTATLAEVESTDPIKFTQGDWTTIQLNTEIATRILQRMGYNTEAVPTEYLAQIEAVKSGDVQMAMEIWFTTAEAQFNEAVASTKGADYGETGMQAKEEWWFPDYMKETCPGLPDWKALNDCAALFASSETGEKGRYIMGPQAWGGYDEERVKALGLNWQVVYAGNDATLNAEIKSAYERQAPVMAWVYAPNWTTSVYKGTWVEFPAYEAACYEDPAWGSNPDLAYDCGKPSGPSMAENTSTKVSDLSVWISPRRSLVLTFDGGASSSDGAWSLDCFCGSPPGGGLRVKTRVVRPTVNSSPSSSATSPVSR